MRALCVCEGGNTRSVTLARLLRNRGYESLPCGVNDHWSLETIDMLFAWADVIFLQIEARDLLRMRNPALFARFEAKMDMRLDVGVDDWNVPMHPDLVSLMRHKLETANIEGST